MNAWHLLMTAVTASLFTVSFLTATVMANPASDQGEAKPNRFWWPDQLDLSPLRAEHPASNPYGESFNYAEEFKKLDLKALKKDIDALLTNSQDWWPADYGNYGPPFHPYGLAQCRHVPHARWTRRRRWRSAAF